MANTAWGIDIGNRALKAVKLIREGDQFRIDDFEIIEHEHVLSNAGDNREALIQQALMSFVQRHDVKGTPIAIGVSGQSSFARFVKLPPVEPKKIPEIVRFEAIQQIPFPLDDVEWSYQLFQTADSPDVEVGIFAMRKELINQHLQHFTDLDLNVQAVQMNPLAVYNAVFNDGRVSGTTMIIDTGAENTDLIIADEETVWLRSIPIGGNNFTEALAKAFKLNFTKAEELKRNAATSKYARQIFQAMRPVFADLVAEIQRSIGFYASVHRDARIRRIVALGGTFRLPGLQKYLNQNLQIPVERLDGLAAGTPPDGKLATVFSENLLSTVSAYGLAIQAMGDAKITSSLLPQHIRRARMWQEKTKWFAAAAALFVIGAGIGFVSHYYHQQQFSWAQTDRQRVDQVLATASNYDRQWSDIQQAGSSDRELIVSVQQLLNYRDIWPNLLSDLHAALPDPQPELVGGNADQIRRIPRTERNLIQIDTVEARYVPDMQQLLDMPEPEFQRQAPGLRGQQHTDRPRTPRTPRGGSPYGGDPYMDYGMMEYEMYEYGMGMEEPGMEMEMEGGPAGAKRGFLLTVRAITPHEDAYSLIDQSFLQSLNDLENNRRGQKRSYRIARTTIASANRLQDNQQRMTEIEQAFNNLVAYQRGEYRPTATAMPRRGGTRGGYYDEMMDYGMDGMMDYYPGATGRRGMAGRAGQPGAAGAEAELDAFADRVTGEDIRDDWEVTILVAVVLDPPAEMADAAGELSEEYNGQTPDMMDGGAPDVQDGAPDMQDGAGEPAGQAVEFDSMQ